MKNYLNIEITRIITPSLLLFLFLVISINLPKVITALIDINERLVFFFKTLTEGTNTIKKDNNEIEKNIFEIKKELQDLKKLILEIVNLNKKQ